MSVPTIWLDAELIGEHVHVKVLTGQQHGQDAFPNGYSQKGPGVSQSPGEAGTFIMRADQWPPFIRALALGGFFTGLRVIWWLKPDLRRLWNGRPDGPCFMGGVEPAPWELPALDAE